MRGFLRSNTFKVLLIVVAVISAVMILSVSTGSATVGSLLGLISTPMKEAAAAVQSGSDDSALQAENAELRKELVDYYELKEQNTQYEEALGLLNEYKEIKLLPGSVISRDITDPYYGFTINKGSLDGVNEGDPVMSGKGLVGRVNKVYATSCRVTTILSEELSIGAISKEFLESGVVTGDAEAASSGCVRLKYLPKETKITAGTIITSSGAGGMYPEDIIIGKVAYIGQSEEDVSLYAVIEPYEDIKAVSSVFVVTDYPGKEDLSSDEEAQTENSDGK